MIQTGLWIVGVYILGWITLVPACVWMLFTRGTRENLAMLFILPVGWIFGYFPIMSSFVTAWKIRKFMKRLDTIKTGDELKREFIEHGMDDVVIELIARENGLPEGIVRRAVKLLPIEALLKRAIEREREGLTPKRD